MSTQQDRQQSVTATEETEKSLLEELLSETNIAPSEDAYNIARQGVSAFVSELRRISEPNSGYGLHLYAGKRPQIDGAALSETLLAETMVIAGDLGQRVYIVPKYDLVAVRLGESPRDWDDAVILNRLLRALEPAAPKRSATDK